MYENLRKLLPLAGVLVILAMLASVGTLSGIDIQTNETVKEEEIDYSASIHDLQFNDQEDTERISVEVPEQSLVTEVRQTGNIRAEGYTGGVDLELESNDLYLRAVTHDGQVTDSDSHIVNEPYYTEEGETFEMELDAFMSYRNSGNEGEAEGALKVVYEDVEFLDVWKQREEDCIEETDVKSFEIESHHFESKDSCMTDLFGEDWDDTSGFNPIEGVIGDEEEETEESESPTEEPENPEEETVGLLGALTNFFTDLFGGGS